MTLINYYNCITKFELILNFKSLEIKCFVFNFHSLWKASQDVEDIENKNFVDTMKVVDA